MKFRNPFVAGGMLDTLVVKPAYQSQKVPRGHKDFIMSRTQLANFMECPRRWKNGYREDATDEMRWGSLVDCLALNPDAFGKIFAVRPEKYPAHGRKKDDPVEMKDWAPQSTWCKEWVAEQRLNGLTVVYPDEYQNAKLAVKALMADEHIKTTIENSFHSVLIWGTYYDEATKREILVQALLDMVTVDDANTIADLKTCQNASPGTWAKTVYFQNYDMQAALYMDIWNVAKNEERNTFAHIVQESEPPYQTARRILSSEFIEIGRLKYTRALALYAKCLATGKWPDYDPDDDNKVLRGWRFTEPAPWMVEASA